MCSKKRKDINVKAFNMITTKNEARTIAKHISCNCKYNFNSTTCNSNKKWNKEACQCEGKNYHNCKNYFSWNLNTCICENRKYLKIIANTSVIDCDEIISVMDIVSIKMTNIMATNVSINCHTKKCRYKIDCYILHTVLLVTILLLVITIVCYDYTKQKIINTLAT